MQPGCAQQLRFFERDFSAYSSFWRPTNVVHAVVPACVLTATVLLVLVTTVDRSAPDYQALAWADLALSIVLVVEWLARFGPNTSLRLDRDEKLRALAHSLPWLIVDGIASSAHLASAALAVAKVGPKLAVDLVAVLRILRLITLVRNTSTAGERRAA